MLVIAHRGASARLLRRTRSPPSPAPSTLGADGVELDVRRTADGRLALQPRRHARRRHASSCEAAVADLPDHDPDLASALDVCDGRWRS